MYHKITIDSSQQTNNNAFKLDENDKEHLALNAGFSTNIEEELSNLDLLSNLSLKDNIFKNFIKHLNDNDAKKYLVAKS